MNRFPNNARVCFVGDSITHTGFYIKHILAYYREHFPDAGVEFYNCGISGGTLGNTLKVYSEDIDIYAPTHIVLMIGVNDSRRGYLTAEPKEKYDIIFEAHENYKRNLEGFYNLTKERGIELTLCTPMPYDEYQVSDVSPLPGGYALMLGYANTVRDFAREKGLALCDYHAAATRAKQTDSLYDADRVHPNERGHFIMAQTFLSSQGFEYPEPMTFSNEIEEWYTTVRKIRCTVATEYFVVPNYTELDGDARMNAVKAYIADMEKNGDDPGAYLKNLVYSYVENKPHQAEYIEFVKRFMKA